MSKFLKFIEIVISIVLLIIIVKLMKFGFDAKTKWGNNNDIFVGLCTLFTGILAITGVCFTIFNSQRLKNKELLNELDQKSEWRKELMNIAAKPVMQLEDVYRVLASLRFLPKCEKKIENKKNKENRDFDMISNYIYNHLNIILNTYYSGLNDKKKIDCCFEKKKLKVIESEEIRQYVKFLLKHHWEYNQGEKTKKEFKKKEINEFLKTIKEVKILTNNFNNRINDYYYQFNSYEEITDRFENDIRKLNPSIKKVIILMKIKYHTLNVTYKVTFFYLKSMYKKYCNYLY